MATNNNTKNISVPAEHADAITHFLQNLSLETKTQETKTKTAPAGMDDDHYEATRVSAHRYDKKTGQLEWKVHFRGYVGGDWISDDDCECEQLIQEYLRGQRTSISTIYVICRVSSKKQAGPTHVSLADQENMVEAAAKSLGNASKRTITRIKTYQITASAYKGIPEKLRYVSEVARRGDIVMVYRVDRLSRNIVKYMALLEEMNNRGVFLYAVEEQIWYHNKKLDFLQLILDANKEAALISRRVKRSVDFRRNRGDYIGSVPFGYRLQRDIDGVVRKVQNDEEQGTLRMIRQLRLRSHVYIADMLNTVGRYKRGKRWTKNMVKYVLLKNQ